MVAYVGTLEWSRDTNGVIRGRDRLTLSGLAVVTAVLDLPPSLLDTRSANLRHAGKPTVVEFVPPSGSAATWARATLKDMAKLYLVNHSLRTYFLSSLMASPRHEHVDDELLYVASLAHDVGLLLPSGPHSPAAGEQELRDAECFSIRGAVWAMDIARRFHWSDDRTSKLGEAVTLNLNGRVPISRGLEAHLMMRGVLADITGLNAWRVDRATRAQLYKKFRVLDQRTTLVEIFQEESSEHPHCRGNFALRCLRLGYLMRHAPAPPTES
jgi:hypothetical protein